MMPIPPKLISNVINEGKTSNNVLFGRKQIRPQYPCNTKRAYTSTTGEKMGETSHFLNVPEIFLLLLLPLPAPFAKS